MSDRIYVLTTKDVGLLQPHTSEDGEMPGAVLVDRGDLLATTMALEVTQAAIRAAWALVFAADACDREAKRHPSSRSSSPVVRSINAMKRLRVELAALREIEGKS